MALINTALNRPSRKCHFLLWLFFGAAIYSSTAQAGRFSEVELSIERPGLLQELTAHGLAADHFRKTGHSTIALILSRDERDVLERLGISYELLIPDMQAHYERMLQGPAGRRAGNCGLAHFDNGSMGGYHTFEEAAAHLQAMQEEFPDIVELAEIGASIEGRPIYAVKISDNVMIDESAAEGVVYFDALHHAREPISMESVLYYMWWLLENYGADAEATYLVDKREMYFVPVVNPDGYVYNQQIAPNGGGLWRKNRRDVGNGCYGIDLNRNYPVGWGLGSGSSNDPCTETYRGMEPFSEPETQAVRNLMGAIRPAIAFSCHTFGDTFLSPYGYADTLVEYETYAEFSSEFIPYTYVGYGTTARMLGYTSSGTTRDYLHSEGTYAWTPEIGHDFWEPASAICERVQEFMPAMKYLSWVSGSFARFQSFESHNGQIWQGDTIKMGVRVKNRGLAFSAADVVVTLESLQPGIVPLSNSINYGDIHPRSFKDNGGEFFTFLVQDEVEAGELLAFEIIISQDGQESHRRQIFLTAGLRTELFSDDFESGAGNWAPGSQPGWDTTFMDSHSGLRSLADSRYGNYPPNANSSVFTIGDIDLSNATYPQLEFNAKWSLEGNNDYVLIQANDGSGFDELEGLNSIYSDGRPRYLHNRHWVQEFVNLSAYIGQPSVFFRYTLRTDGGIHSDGFYVDDFKVVDYTEPPISHTTAPGAAGLKMSVAPNPGRGVANLDIDSPVASPAMLSFFSASGQLLWREEQRLARGNNRFPLNLSSLRPGLYWLKLSTASGVQVAQIVVL